MTPSDAVRTVAVMLKLTRRNRQNYLHDLAAEPLFRNVPKHLMPLVARSVDVIELEPGRTLTCDPAREVIILIEGEALLADNGHRPLALIGSGRAIGSRDRRDDTGRRLTAIGRVRCVAIARRELRPIIDIAPEVARAVDARIPVPVRDRSTVGTSSDALQVSERRP